MVLQPKGGTLGKWWLRMEDVGDFAKVVSHFALHNYDPYLIINEYTGLESVRREIMAISGRILQYNGEERMLNEKLEVLKPQLESVTQTIKAYSELKEKGLGLKEPKLLVSIVKEIVQANEVSDAQAVKKFLKDVQEQFDDKLGFEKIVNEKSMELDWINRNLAISQSLLLSQQYIGPVLSNLLRFGLTCDDIVNIHLLVSNTRIVPHCIMTSQPVLTKTT